MIRLLSCFSGIGAFEKALDNLEVPYELVGFCEIDKYASASYSAIHNVPETMNLGDITKVDEKALPKDIDLLTYGFPCQDISLSGKMKGLLQCEECNTSNEIPENYVQRLKDGEKFYCEKCGAELKQTRSGLFFEALRIIEEAQPRVAIAENVKNLTSKTFKNQFEIVLDSLEMAGYNNYWAVLNSKDFGVPQNRERVFIVSVRKDIDTGTFKFPEGFPLEIRLKDVLEDEVDEKYYLSDKMIDYLATITVKNKARGNGNVYVPTDPEGISKTITTKEGSRVKDNFIEEPAVKQIANLMPSKTRDNPNQGRLYDKEGLSPTLGAMQGGNRQPFVIVDDDSVKIREATQTGYAEAVEGDSINLEQPNSKTRRGRVGKQVAQTLTTAPQQGVVINDYIQKAIDENIEIPCAVDEQNKYVRNDGTVGTIMTDGSSPKHNNRVIVESDLIVYDGFDQRVRNDQSCVGTLTQNVGKDLKRNGQGLIERSGNNLRIRKLTPKECFRLMGFDDFDFLSAKTGSRQAAIKLLEEFPNHQGKKLMTEAERISKMSNTQLYKQAGNSIVVPVVEYIIKALLDYGALNKEKEMEKEEMELRIEPYKAPEQISFNYEELKAALIEKCAVYETMVYTDDQIRDAKADRANLNRLKKALNDERLKQEREYMTSFNVFKGQIKELCEIIDKAVANSDKQVKAFEEQQKEKKFEEIKAYWAEVLQADRIPAGITFDHLFDEKWLNASVKMSAIEKEFDAKLDQIEKDLVVLENLPSYAFEAKEVYINTLDLGKAITEANRLREVAEKKAAWEAEQERMKTEAAANKPSEPVDIPPTEPARQWVKFQAFMTVEEAKALGQYMRSHGIQYKAV